MSGPQCVDYVLYDLVSFNQTFMAPLLLHLSTDTRPGGGNARIYYSAAPAARRRNSAAAAASAGRTARSSSLVNQAGLVPVPQTSGPVPVNRFELVDGQGTLTNGQESVHWDHGGALSHRQVPVDMAYGVGSLQLVHSGQGGMGPRGLEPVYRDHGAAGGGRRLSATVDAAPVCGCSALPAAGCPSAFFQSYTCPYALATWPWLAYHASHQAAVGAPPRNISVDAVLYLERFMNFDASVSLYVTASFKVKAVPPFRESLISLRAAPLSLPLLRPTPLAPPRRRLPSHASPRRLASRLVRLLVSPRGAGPSTPRAHVWAAASARPERPTALCARGSSSRGCLGASAGSAVPSLNPEALPLEP